MTSFFRLSPIDAGDCAAIHAASFHTPWTSAAFADMLSDEKISGFGLKEQALIAFAVFRVLPDEADLLTLATHADQQRRGHARALLGGAAKSLAARRITRITLDVAADNAAALALYRQFGFTEDGRRPKYYRRNNALAIDAILMSSPVSRNTGLSRTTETHSNHDTD